MARQITIDIVGDSSKFSKSTTDAVSAGEKLPGKFTSIGSGIGKGIAVGLGAFTLILGVIQEVISIVGDADAAFKEDEASQNMLAQSLGRANDKRAVTIDQLEKQISANQALGVSDSEQRTGIADFIDLTGSASEAMALNQAAIELSAAKGITYAQAEDEVKSAVAGKTKALVKDGVEVNNHMTATEISTAVLDKYGGSLDKVAETSAGKSAIANEKVGEAMEKLGGIVDGIAQVVMPALADAFATVVDVITNVYDALAPSLIPAFKVLGDVFKVVVGVAAKVWEALKPVRGIIIDLIFPIKGVIDIVGILVGVFQGMGKVVGTIWSGVTTAIKGAINGVIDIINGVIGAINKIQVHIHVGPVGIDWDGLKLGKIPKLHSGGIVPGAPGQEVLTMLQAGERVTPAGQAGAGGGVTIIFQGPVFAEDQFIDEFSRKLAMRLRTAG